MKDQVIMRDLCWISCFVVFQVLFMYFLCKAPLLIQKVPLLMKTNKTRSICVYTYIIYTYMHHQIPTKMIYLVDLPSVLYERPGQNKRPVLNQLFLLLFRYFRWFSQTFHKKHHCSYKKWQCLMKTNKIGSICVYTCTIYTHMHHMHHKYHQNIRYT